MSTRTVIVSASSPSGPTEIPADTSPEAAAVQARLFAEMRPSDRMRAAFDLSATMRRMTLAGIRSREGELSDEELKERLIEICYGDVIPK